MAELAVVVVAPAVGLAVRPHRAAVPAPGAHPRAGCGQRALLDAELDRQRLARDQRDVLLGVDVLHLLRVRDRDHVRMAQRLGAHAHVDPVGLPHVEREVVQYLVGVPVDDVVLVLRHDAHGL